MTAYRKSRLTIGLGLGLFVLALLFVGCAPTSAVVKTRTYFCRDESCPAQLQVRWWLVKFMWAVYDEKSDACYCVMMNDAGKEVTLTVPRLAPADSEVVR